MVTEPSIFLQTHHLSKQVQSAESEIHILRDINLTIRMGESVAILGSSGSGKTTLLTILAGLQLPSNGKIEFLGHSLEKLDEEQRAIIRGQNVGFIFQSFQLLPTLTALENVMLPLEIQFIKTDIARKTAQKWLERVGLQERLHYYPDKLSGGEQQRVAIARAFVVQPKIIFADEMTGNLDVKTGKIITDILFEINKSQNTTLVLVTHDDELAKRCNRQLLLREGILESC